MYDWAINRARFAWMGRDCLRSRSNMMPLCCGPIRWVPCIVNLSYNVTYVRNAYDYVCLEGWSWNDVIKGGRVISESRYGGLTHYLGGERVRSSSSETCWGSGRQPHNIRGSRMSNVAGVDEPPRKGLDGSSGNKTCIHLFECSILLHL